MNCRVENQRETEYRLHEYIRKHTYIYYCTFKNTNIDFDCNIFDKISKLKICYDKVGNLPNKGRNFNKQTWGKMYISYLYN